MENTMKTNYFNLIIANLVFCDPTTLILNPDGTLDVVTEGDAESYTTFWDNLQYFGDGTTSILRLKLS